MVLTVIWPLHVFFDAGEEITIHAGWFVERDDIIATRIETSGGNARLELSENDIEILVSEEERALARRPAGWSLNPGYEFPIRGIVLRCNHWVRGERASTLTDIHVVGQNPYNCGRAIEAQAMAAVPSFWACVDIRHQWRGIYPDTHRRREIEKERPRMVTEAGNEARVAVARLYQRHQCVDQPTFAQYTAYAEEKVAYVERHRNRLAYLKDTRMCLYDSDRNIQPFDILLTETVQETLLTVEALCFTALSALDILARAVDHLLSVTVSPKQRRSRATFASLLGVRETIDEESEARPSLLSAHPDLPLTNLWSAAWSDWVSTLAQLRHKVAHDAVLFPVEVSHAGCAFEEDIPDARSLTTGQSRDALEFADDVVRKLQAILRDSMLLMAEMAKGWAETEVVNLPKYPSDLPTREWSPTNINLEEALDSWKAISAGDDKAALRFYHRVHPKLKKVWSRPECESFLRSNPLISYRIMQGRASTDKQYGQVYRALVRMILADREVDTWISVAPVRSDRWHIIREPISTFPDTVRRIECDNMWRRQSGEDSGYRNVLYGARITNVSSELLTNLAITLYDGGRVADYLDLQTTQMGNLSPREAMDLNLCFENGCLPPYGFGLINGPLSLRVCYGVPDGQRYAADFAFTY